MRYFTTIPPGPSAGPIPPSRIVRNGISSTEKPVAIPRVSCSTIHPRTSSGDVPSTEPSTRLDLNELLPTVLSRFSRYIHYEIDRKFQGVDDGMSEKLVHESHRDVIISVNKWDGASVDQIRQDFVLYLATTPRGLEFTNPWFKECLVIDAPALRSSTRAPEPENWRFGMQRPFVGMVDAQYVESLRWVPKGYRSYS